MSSSSSDSESETNEPREEGAPKPAGGLKHVSSREKDEEPAGGEKTEAQLAMEAQRKKHLEQEEQWLKEYQEMRTQEREREADELVKLKERQAERRKERDEEDKVLAEKRRVMEEKRREEEEEIRKRREEERQRRQQDAEKRRAELTKIMGGYAGVPQPNYVIQKQTREKVAPIAKEKTPEELQREKEETVQRRLKNLASSNLSGDALKERARELHRRMVKLEIERYESEDKIKRQEYDLKELTERQKLVQKQKLMKLGIDPTSEEAKMPPKVQVASKYERRTDRRSYKDRINLFEQGGPTKEIKKDAIVLQK